MTIRRTYKTTLPATVTVTLPAENAPPEPEILPPFIGGAAFAGVRKLVGVVRIRPYRLATRLGTAAVAIDGDHEFLRNIYREVSQETTLTPGEHESAVNRQALLDARQRVFLLYSDREVWATHQFQVDAETDGTITTIVLVDARTGVETRLDPLGETAEWQKRRPLAERLARLAADADDPNQTDLNRLGSRRAYAEVRREQNEAWDPESLGRVGREGALVGRVSPGRSHLRVESFRHFNTFDLTTDAEGEIVGPYSCRREANVQAELAPVPSARVAPGQSADVELWLTPRIHDLEVSWTTIFIWVTLWSFGFIFSENRRRWRDQLPFSPLAYSLTGGVGTGMNDAAVSQKVIRSRAYPQMLAADHGREARSQFFQLLVWLRQNGQWAYHEGDVLRDTLLGIVSIGYPGGVEEAYILREEDWYALEDTFDSGGLTTDLVSPFVYYSPAQAVIT